jgi:hypothetical protein
METTRRREPDNEGDSLRKASPKETMEENVKRLALSKRPQLALFFRPVSI